MPKLSRKDEDDRIMSVIFGCGVISTVDPGMPWVNPG